MRDSSLLTETQRARLRSGDIVFIGVPYPVYTHIAATCQSWDSHVGIIFREPDGSLSVLESRVPLCVRTTLDRFLARAADQRFVIRRLHGGLSDEQAQRLRTAAERRLGKVYHLGFDFDSGRLFCSKFVYEVYREVLGVEIGCLETFRELFTKNPAAPLRFWRFWFFGRIPWERRTVTPTSQLRSPLLEAVAASP